MKYVHSMIEMFHEYLANNNKRDKYMKIYYKMSKNNQKNLRPILYSQQIRVFD